MEPRIVVRQLGTAEPRIEEFPLGSFIDITMGREADCQVQFGDDRWDMVSRHHARITVTQQEPPQVQLTDLKSSNGTFVNGVQVSGDVRLNPGDRVQLGVGGPEFEVALAGVRETRLVADPKGTRKVPALAGGSAVSVPPSSRAGVVLPSEVVTVPSAFQPSRRWVLYAGAVLAAEGLVSTAAWYLGGGKGVAAYKVFHQRLVISGAYKAYGNPEAWNGRYWFAKVVIKNTGVAPLKDVRVAYQIPDYISWTTPDRVAEIAPGGTCVFVYYPKFSPKVTELRTRTPATLETKIEYDDGGGVQSRVEKREFEFFGLTEFAYTSLPASEIVTYADMGENDRLLAAYVHDEDPAVKLFYAKISDVSKFGIPVMKGQEDLLRLMKSVHNYLLSLGMTYSGAKGVPDFTAGVSSTVQSIRVARELIYGNSGLCIELALLWCALGQIAGAKSYLVMIPGHAYPLLQADDGSRLAIEATAISKSSGLNFTDWEKAVNFGTASFFGTKTEQGDRDKSTTEVLDIQQLQSQGIRPPELPSVDLAELSKLLDDRRAKRAPATPTLAQRRRWFRF